MNSENLIGSVEEIVRILHKDWIVDGVLQINAFVLRQNETYISVYRPAIVTFAKDVSDFVRRHPAFVFSDEALLYRQAKLNVGKVRCIKVELGQHIVNVQVSVEPRNLHYLSHAGIFTRHEGKNLKGGQQTAIQIDDQRRMPVSAILQKVQFALLSLAKLEECHLPDKNSSIDVS